MSKERQRVVYQEWVRDPNGKLLEKPPPRGSRPENNIIWGHTLEDFYWISRIPGVNVLTIWSRSMIEEYGENYLNVNGTREKGPEPRRLRPWPVLTLPEHVASSADLGYVDEGCGERHEHAPRRMEDENKDATRAKAKAKLICPTLLSLECCPVLYCPPGKSRRCSCQVCGRCSICRQDPLVALVDAASSGATASSPPAAFIGAVSALAPLTPAPTEQKEEQKESTPAAAAFSSSVAGTTTAVTESIEAASALAPPAPAPSTEEREPAPVAESEHTASLQVDTITAPPPPGNADPSALAHGGSTTPISATLVSASPSEDLMKMSLKTTSWDCIPEANAAAHTEPVDVEPVGLVDPDVARVLDERRSALLGKAQVPAADTMDVDADTPATEQPESGAAPTTPQASSQTPGAETKEVALPKAEEGSNENDGADTKAPWGDTPPTDGAFAPAAPAEAMAVDAPKVQGGAPCAENVQAVTAADTATSCKDTPPTDTASAPAASAESSVEAKAVDAPKVQGAEKVEAAPALTAEAKVAAEPAAGAEPTTQAEPTRVVPETKAPPPTPEPPFFHDLPTLEEFIPEEYFPDILYVNDPDNRTAMEYYHSRYDPHKPQSEESVPRKYKRVWPRFARDTEPATAFNTDPDCASIKLPAPPTSAQSSSPSPSALETNLRIARLNLSSAPILGTGNHSVVCRAALRLPPPLSASAARSSTGEVAVAAKTAHSGSEARALLRNEGKMYDAFPKHLQEDWCGLNLVAPIVHPVPVGAVVPKFYGYYVPVMEDVERAKQRYAREWKEKKRREAKERRLMKKKLDAARRAKEEEDAAKAGKEKGTEGSGEQVDGDKMDSTKLEDEDEEEDPVSDPVSDPVAEAAAISRDFMQTASYKAWHRMSPILLLEECGKPIKPEHFTPDERSECYSLALRLHFAEFTQNSFYVRNILRQPGPLTVAPSARSDKTPSFRIIDHGRGEHWPLMLEAAKKEIEIEQQRRKERKATLASMDVPTEAQMKRRVDAEEVEEKDDKEKLEAATKRWWELQDYEVRKAHSELQIPDFDY
ncbi:hypothetical protein MSAN_01137300 [Mycena sanguinolenta]|uniref:Uncharacterized protein n=1 Tax=Mycena sanguinolenta TaxID=230812 RepID=A0A8H6YL75_9AGAR|nr:hypothetical protein MSAN_01137300 [Mycena sanguinolenta]